MTARKRADLAVNQADYRLVTDRKICPLMSKADPGCSTMILRAETDDRLKLLAENMEREAALWRDGGFIGAANAYEDSSTRIREILKGDAVEEQAGYGKDKPKCPLSNDVNGVYDCGKEKCAWWTGSECAIVALAMGTGRYKPPLVPGL